MTALYKVVECNGCGHIETVDGRCVAYDMLAEDARRIVACMNALQGAPTKFLEDAVQMGITDVSRGNMFSSRMKLQRERDNLLCLLKEIKNSGAWYNSALEFDHDVDGEELLAKVERYIEAIDK